MPTAQPRSRSPTSATSVTCRSSRCTSRPVTRSTPRTPADVGVGQGHAGRPGPAAGTVGEVLVKVGDEVSEGTPILMLSSGDGAITTPPSLVEQQEPAPGPARPQPVAEAVGAPLAAPPAVAGGGREHGAGGRARRAERAADGPRAGHRPVGRSRASGPKGRITKDDLLGFLKGPAEPPRPRRRRPRRARGSRRSPRRTSRSSAPSRRQDAAADQEGVGPVPAPLVAERPARHAQRRRRHHRAGRLPQAARHRGQGRPEPLPGHAAGVPGQGRGRRAEEAPGVQLEL